MTEINQNLDLPKLLEAAQKAADQGRHLLLDYFGQLKNVKTKHLAGLVTEADEASEKLIRSVLAADFPNIYFRGEEDSFRIATSSGEQTGGSARPESRMTQWHVDPLDGTTNYVHQFPIFCISIGLEWQGEMVLGVIDVPMLNQRFVATKGFGASLNGKPISVSDKTKIEDSLLATGFFAEKPGVLEEQLKIFSRLVYKARGVRRAGAAAYDLCMVAQGVFDGYWEKGLSSWDTAAGCVIVREAGGQVSNYQGQEFHPSQDSILASNGKLHSLLLSDIF